MKYIAIFLLLANIGYFSWLNFGADPIKRLAFSGSEDRPLLNDGMILLVEYQARVAEEEVIAAQLYELNSRVCLSVNNFVNFDDAVDFADSAVGLGLSPSQQLLGVVQPSQYRVFLPPASSRAVATITLEGLNKRATEAELAIESYLITRGSLENGIALGVFASLDASIGVQLALGNLGYSPQIQELPQSDGGVVVYLSGSGSLSLESEAWLDLSAERTYLIATENLCETIAQGAQFP